ncbi:hypothetical protein BKA82DRAFT_140319, partial [Pisolithus tinctorius]
QEFATHLLFSSPRLRFSEAQKKSILNWGTSLGATGVPSLHSLKKTQERIKNLFSNPTEKVTAASGNVFYLNSISKALAMDFANPLTRFSMQDYPEEGDGRMSQVHHGYKMLEGLPDNLAPPCVRNNNKIFFINELLRLASREYFIPKKYFQAKLEFESEAEVLSLGHLVSVTGMGFAVDPEMVVVKVSTFTHTFPEIEACKAEFGVGFTESSARHAHLMPNSLREKSGGRMVLTVPLIVFMDDVSGNVSKQWNKHHVIYMSNASMSRDMLEKEFCVRFVSSSPHAAPLELMRGVKESIQKAASDGVITWDAKYHEEVMLIPYNLFLAGDNPMQAEECSHGGLKCNYFCRTCRVGGTMAEKKSDSGYSDIFEAGELRTQEKTLSEIKEQIEMSKLSGGTEKVKTAVSQTGTRDAATAAIVDRLLDLGKQLRKRDRGKPAIPEAEVRAQLEREFEVALAGRSLEDHINPLLGMAGVDVHKDTPTEILHTILLGIVKYYWGQTVYILDKSHLLNVFQTRLESLNKDGLKTPTLGAEYIVRYKGALIGKHFKSLAQVMPYLIYDIVPRTVLDGWTVIGELVVLLWHTVIEDKEVYLAKLSCTINEFLSISAQCAPSILITKAKFHFLLHLPMFIRRFGPAIIFSTERFESFNHVFRLASIYSNRQAPSRDTCKAFAEQDAVKHIVTGGSWLNPKSRNWVRAGERIMSYIGEHPEQRHLLGLPNTKSQINGKSEVIPAVEWTSTRSAAVAQPGFHQNVTSNLFIKCKSFVTTDGDKASIGSHVICSYDQSAKYSIGKVVEILAPHQQYMATHITISRLHFLPELHQQLRVPCLRFPTPESEVVISPKNILCTVNIQHDCAASGTACDKPQEFQERQERSETTKKKVTFDHAPTNMYVLNVHALHNYQRVSAAIPEGIQAQRSMERALDHQAI